MSVISWNRFNLRILSGVGPTNNSAMKDNVLMPRRRGKIDRPRDRPQRHVFPLRLDRRTPG